MLNFTRERQNNLNEDLSVNNQQMVDGDVNASSDIKETYGHTDWMRDFNNSHNTKIVDDYDANYSNFSAFDQVFSENTEEANTYSTASDLADEDFTIQENENGSVVINLVDDKQKEAIKRKKELSARAKVHIAIYSAILILILSMIIANAWMTSIANGTNSMIVHAEESIAEIDSSSNDNFLLPTGDLVKLDDVKIATYTGESKNTDSNWFDRMCDGLEGEK